MVTWAIEFGVQRAVSTHSLAVEDPPDLGDRDRQALGARHFELQCVSCHGSPAAPPMELARHMLPVPPDLANKGQRWSDEEMFWIVQHGLKFTAMPAWSTRERGDEVWSMVAFLRRLPSLDGEAYRTLSGSGEGGSCARCHGAENTGPVSRFIPMLHGQSEAYLVRALQEYRDGKRVSGMMQPEAHGLPDAEIVRLARLYAGLRSPATTVQPREQNAGEKIATTGIPEQNVPACLACHGGSTGYPILAGQPAPYLEGQLALWRRGVRGNTAHGAIMAAIGSRLTAEQARAVAQYFESVQP
jgi:cytochrome c553